MNNRLQYYKLNKVYNSTGSLVGYTIINNNSNYFIDKSRAFNILYNNNLSVRYNELYSQAHDILIKARVLCLSAIDIIDKIQDLSTGEFLVKLVNQSGCIISRNTANMCASLDDINIAIELSSSIEFSELEGNTLNHGINYLLAKGNNKELDFSKINISNIESLASVVVDNNNIESVKFGSTNFHNLKSMHSAFSDDCGLKSVDISGIKIEQSLKLDMQQAFYACIELEDIKLFDTSNVSTFHDTFAFTSTIKTIKNISLKSVKNTDDMFHCSDISMIEFLPCKADEWESAVGMFNSCLNIESVDLSMIEANNINSIKTMFAGCKQLKSIKLPMIDNKNSKEFNARQAFKNCELLENIDMSSIHTQYDCNVDLADIITGCSSLKTLDIRNMNISSKQLILMISDTDINKLLLEKIYVNKSTYDNFGHRSEWMDKIASHIGRYIESFRDRSNEISERLVVV